MGNSNKFHSELKEWSSRHIGTTDENLNKVEIKSSPTTKKKKKVGKIASNGKRLVPRPKKKYVKVEIPKDKVSSEVYEHIDRNSLTISLEPIEVKACLALVESNSNMRLTKRKRKRISATFVRRVAPDSEVEYTPKKRVPNEIRRVRIY